MSPSSRPHLRPVSVSDYDEIYRWTTDRRNSVLWRYRGGTPSPETVQRQLWEGVLVQYCVVTDRSSRPLGLVSLYNANHVAALSAPELVGSGLVARAALEIVQYGFERFRFRKLYLESLESSLQFYRSALNLGVLSEAGRLANHEWNGSDYDDLVFLFVTREQWTEFVGRRTWSLGK